MALQRLPRPYSDQVIIRGFTDDGRDPEVPSGAVALVIGDSLRTTVHMDVSGNCRAESGSRQIRCDLSLVRDLVRELQLGGGEAMEAELLSVILAHELGHVILGHGRAAYHGDESGISVLSYAQHRTELEADAFAVELLDRTSEPINGVYRLVEYLARSAQHRSLCPDVFPAPCPCTGAGSFAGCTTLSMGPGLPSPNGAKVKVTLRGTHPAYVVRFIRMLSLSSAPRMREVYSRDAMFELSNMVVRDETGRTQTMEPLFRESRSGRAARLNVGKVVREAVARAERHAHGRAGSPPTTLPQQRQPSRPGSHAGSVPAGGSNAVPDTPRDRLDSRGPRHVRTDELDGNASAG